jgi:hypothetical protein
VAVAVPLSFCAESHNSMQAACNSQEVLTNTQKVGCLQGIEIFKENTNDS